MIQLSFYLSCQSYKNKSKHYICVYDICVICLINIYIEANKFYDLISFVCDNYNSVHDVTFHLKTFPIKSCWSIVVLTKSFRFRKIFFQCVMMKFELKFIIEIIGDYKKNQFETTKKNKQNFWQIFKLFFANRLALTSTKINIEDIRNFYKLFYLFFLGLILITNYILSLGLIICT